MPSPANSSNDESKGLPNWLSASIIILVVAGGVFALWRYFEGGSGDMPASASISLTDANVVGPGVPRERGPGRPPNFGQFTSRMAANMPDGIMPAGNAYLVKAGTVRLDVDRQTGANNPGGWRYRFSYALPNLVPPDQVLVLRTARRAMGDAAAAQKAGVTAEQLQQLRNAMNGGVAMVVDAPDRARISTLFDAWLAASGRSPTTAPAGMAATRPITAPSPLANLPQAKTAEEELLAALNAVGTKQLDPTRQAVASRVQHIHAILGDQLLQKLKPTG
jgi:hypothetical protein